VRTELKKYPPPFVQVVLDYYGPQFVAGSKTSLKSPEWYSNFAQKEQKVLIYHQSAESGGH
jgi:hypothetical protein